jgi:hypothetical protein
MHALALMLKPIDQGWAVALTDGRELARFRGLCAKRRALRYLAARGLLRETRRAADRW